VPFIRQEHARSLPLGSDLPAGAHVLGIWRDEQGTSYRFGLALFGYLVAGAELRDLDWPSDERTWIVPSNGSREPRLSRAQFRDLLAQRDAAARERARRWVKSAQKWGYPIRRPLKSPATIGLTSFARPS